MIQVCFCIMRFIYAHEYLYYVFVLMTIYSEFMAILKLFILTLVQIKLSLLLLKRYCFLFTVQCFKNNAYIYRKTRTHIHRWTHPHIYTHAYMHARAHTYLSVYI